MGNMEKITTDSSTNPLDLFSGINELEAGHQEDIYEAIQIMIKCSDISRKTKKYINQVAIIRKKKHSNGN